MHSFQIDPVALRLGPLHVYWYGLMYMLGFLIAWLLANYRAHRPGSGWSAQQVSDLLFYGALGVIIGGRLGYMLFYDFSTLLAQPSTVFKIWQGGMSFHGGLLGVLAALWLYSRKFGYNFFEIIDFCAPLVPTGLAAGRIGNFINGELWGRVTDVPWAMVFARADSFPRHPSQLYEFLVEGVLLFSVLWVYSNRPRPPRAVSALFAVLYATGRFILEFFRQPDPQWGFIAWGWLTMGQLLSIPLFGVGVVMLYQAYHPVNPCISK